MSLYPNAVKYKRRFCKVDGCQRTVKSQKLCQRHGAKPRVCKLENCGKQAQGNYEGMCKAHFKMFKRESSTPQARNTPTSSPFNPSFLLPIHQSARHCQQLALASSELPFFSENGFPLHIPPTYQAGPPVAAMSSCLPVSANPTRSKTWDLALPDKTISSCVPNQLKSQSHNINHAIATTSREVSCSWINEMDFRSFVQSADDITRTTNLDHRNASTSTQTTASITLSSDGEDDWYNVCGTFDKDYGTTDSVHPDPWDELIEGTLGDSFVCADGDIQKAYLR